MALLFIHPEGVVRRVVTKPPSTSVRQTTLYISEHFVSLQNLRPYPNRDLQDISTQSWVESIAIKSDVTY